MMSSVQITTIITFIFFPAFLLQQIGWDSSTGTSSYYQNMLVIQERNSFYSETKNFTLNALFYRNENERIRVGLYAGPTSNVDDARTNCVWQSEAFTCIDGPTVYSYSLSGHNDVFPPGQYYFLAVWASDTVGSSWYPWTDSVSQSDFCYKRPLPFHETNPFPSDSSWDCTETNPTLHMYITVDLHWYCFDKLMSNSLACNEGSCIDFNKCSCGGSYGGIECEFFNCYGTLSNETYACNEGSCVAPNECICDDDHGGVNCEIPKCFGILGNESAVCNYGTCSDVNECICNSDHEGDECELNYCFGILSNETACNMNGTCTGKDICSCFTGFDGEECELMYCHGVLSNESSSCNSGVCAWVDTCDCSGTNYFGDNCDEWNCFGEHKDSTNACSGHGSCNDFNNCLCNPGYTVSSKCDFWKCYGYAMNDSLVCTSQNGVCESKDYCNCPDGVIGNYCEAWSCGGVPSSQLVSCNGRGTCTGPNNCSCLQGYKGGNCENAITYPDGAAIFFSIAIPLVVIILVIIIIIVVVVVLIYVFKKKKRVVSKEDLMFMKMEEVEGRKSMAKFAINEKLFEIKMGDIILKKQIGSGGSGAHIFKAEWNSLEVAMKVFQTKTFSSNESYEEFEKEVAILGSISHPHILHFYGCTLQQPRIGIVMEFCENGTITEFISKNPNYEFDEKVRFLLEICAGMIYLHDRNIIHRDVKSENVLIDKNRSVKLIDFGLSKILETSAVQMTKRAGTSQYMAPEVVLTNKYDGKCDVFSFSIVVWEIINENWEPYGKGSFAVELKVANNENFRPDLEHKAFLENQWLRDLVVSCWNHDPKSRPTFRECSEVIKSNTNITYSVVQKEGNEKKHEKTISIGGVEDGAKFIQETGVDEKTNRTLPSDVLEKDSVY